MAPRFGFTRTSDRDFGFSDDFGTARDPELLPLPLLPGRPRTGDPRTIGEDTGADDRQGLLDDLIGLLGEGGGEVDVLGGGRQAPNFPTPIDFRTLLPPFERTQQERQASLFDSLGGVRESLGNVSNIALTTAARAGLDPRSGSVQNFTGGLLQRIIQEEGGIRRADFLQEQDDRRQREQFLGGLGAAIEQSRLGAFGTIEAANLGQSSQFAALRLQQAMFNANFDLDEIERIIRILFPDTVLPGDEERTTS